METTSLDEDLVSDFETGDKLYNRFYKAVPGELTCSFIYINNNSIIFIKKVSTKLEKGILEKTE